ncbi:hypothetical protein ACLKA7_003596 [Drosophila subpalustris]
MSRRSVSLNGQRYNNNNNAGGGSRHPSLKNNSDVDRKDRGKRRVSFKTSQSTPHQKSDVKLRLQDVRRWNVNDDMMTTTMTSQNRPRRRGSPIPRGKLVPNSVGWYQVTINLRDQNYEMETLLNSLQAAIAPQVFIPQYWRLEQSRVIFITDDFEAAQRIQQLRWKINLPDGVPLMPLVSSGVPQIIIDEELKERMKLVMAKRYNVETKALDLSRFHADPDLKPNFCPLYTTSVMRAALDIISQNIPDLVAINLNDNQLFTMEAFKGTDKRLLNLKILHLGDNKLPSLVNLFVFCHLPLVELVLRNNPCCLRYKNRQQFVRQVRRKFPNLVQLDGEGLMPHESVALPAAKASFLCNSEAIEVIRQFLDQFFNIFDSGNRQPLLDAYHEHALLSMSMPSMSQAGRLDSFWKFNRNLRRTMNTERSGDLHLRLLKIGRLSCVSAMGEWPRTQHDRRFFTVDLTLCNAQMMVFTVTGLFKELTADPDAYELRHFVRSFVVVPQNAGFCIRNETVFITSRLRVPSAVHFCLHDFKFDDIHFEDDDTLKACLRMFLDLDFVERFHIDYEVLCRWLLSVKKNYRNVTYHNWRHAFNVAQMMFAILTTTQWWKIFGEIECLALIIGCLCHDLDHRGTNNSFQIKASSPLAQLYSTSTMEHHHFDQCLMILNSPGNQILANLSSDDYCRVIRVLEDAILSTDLAVYFKKRGPFLESVQQPMSYWVSEEPRALLRAMSMTVCDLSAITKPWEIEKRVADLVSSEFFEQGDMEKQELNITPIDIMNREKEDELPMMQVNFIDSICLPIYEAFAQLSEKLEPLVDGVRDNRGHWIDMADDVKSKTSQDQQQQIVIANGDSKQGTADDNVADVDADADVGAETEAVAVTLSEACQPAQ